MTCPGFEELVDYVDGRLASESLETVRSHLGTGCGPCDVDRNWYEQVKLVAATDDTIEPPPWVLKRSLRIFDATRARTSFAVLTSRLIASLVFDSLRRPTLAGARSSAVDGRQMLYQAEPYSIDLQVAVLDESRAELTGQILREGELMFESVSGLRLDLIHDGETVLSTVTNDRGEFRVTTVDVGNYDLRVDASDASITIVGLPIE
jgi:hypothetical protein